MLEASWTSFGSAPLENEINLGGMRSATLPADEVQNASR